MIGRRGCDDDDVILRKLLAERVNGSSMLFRQLHFRRPQDVSHSFIQILTERVGAFLIRACFYFMIKQIDKEEKGGLDKNSKSMKKKMIRHKDIFLKEENEGIDGKIDENEEGVKER